MYVSSRLPEVKTIENIQITSIESCRDRFREVVALRYFDYSECTGRNLVFWKRSPLWEGSLHFYLVNTRMRSKRDVKMGPLCTRAGGSLRNCRWGCDVPFFKSSRYFRLKHVIFHTFIRSRGSLKNHTWFQTVMVKVISVFWPKGLKKLRLWGATYLWLI